VLLSNSALLKGKCKHCDGPTTRRLVRTDVPDTKTATLHWCYTCDTTKLGDTVPSLA